MKRIAIVFGVIILAFVSAAAIIGVLYSCATGAFVRAKDINFSNPEQAVSDAQQFIRDFEKSKRTDEKGRWIAGGDLPASLRINKLRYAVVFTNHLNLVMGRNPDWSIGARIWSIDSVTPHDDQPTKYKDIFFFEYCNDLPLSQKNQP